MEINLTHEQNDVVRHAIETGRVHDCAQVMNEAMALWVERERRRAELLACLDVAEASLARGEGRIISRETMQALVSDVMERNRHRFPATEFAKR